MQSNQEQLEIKTDRAPIEKRLPEFPETKKLYWISTRIGERTPGPTSLQLDIWAVLDKEVFQQFIDGASFVDAEGFSPVFFPNELEGTYDWKKMDDTYIFDVKKFGVSYFNEKVYVDVKHNVIYVQAVGEK